MKLDFLAAINQIKQAQGLWLIYGEEPLLYQLMLDQFRAIWKKNGVERKRFDLSTLNDWRDPISETANLSLFSDHKAIEVHSSLKPDGSHLKALERFMQDSGGQIFLVVMPNFDTAAQKTNFHRSVEANGQVVKLTIYKEEDKYKVLQRIALRNGLNLSQEAWKMLFAHNQNNLLAAYQAILKLSMHNYDEQLVSVAQLQDELFNQSRYNSFNLIDEIITGHTEQALLIIDYLKQTQEPASYINTLLSREINNLMRLKSGISSIQLGVWPARARQLQMASQKLSGHQLETSLQLLIKIDQAIKGVIKQSPYTLLEELIIALRFNK